MRPRPPFFRTPQGPTNRSSMITKVRRAASPASTACWWAATMSRVPRRPPRHGAAPAPAPGADARPLFSSLYSEGQSGPVSQFVKDLWTTRPVVAAALTGQTGNQPGYQAAPHVESVRGSPATPAARAQGAPLALFSDRPTDARGLCGVGS